MFLLGQPPGEPGIQSLFRDDVDDPAHALERAGGQFAVEDRGANSFVGWGMLVGEGSLEVRAAFPQCEIFFGHSVPLRDYVMDNPAFIGHAPFSLLVDIHLLGGDMQNVYPAPAGDDGQ